MEDEINLLDILRVIFKFKYFILIIVIIATFSAAFKESKKPKMYQATATILVMQNSVGLGGNLSSILSGLPLNLGRSEGGSMYDAILKSRLLAGRVVEDLDLSKVFYKQRWDTQQQKWEDDFTPSLEQLAAMLSSGLKVQTNPNSTMTIAYTSNDPVLAAKIANSYVKILAGFLAQNPLGISFQVLDPAIEPISSINAINIKKSVMTAGGVSLVVAIFMAFVLNYVFEQLKILKKGSFK